MGAGDPQIYIQVYPWFSSFNFEVHPWRSVEIQTCEPRVYLDALILRGNLT